MKSHAWIRLILSTFIVYGCGTTKKVLSVKPNEHMEVGWTPRSVFQSPAYAVWYDTGYSQYQPKEEYADRLKMMTDSVEIYVVYGMWCSDSKREMPRFFKVMDLAGFPGNQITLVAVDRTKQIPAGIAKEYNITHVPTFIVKYRGIEMGRIVESTQRSIEEDLTEMLAPLFP